jgi:uncharacterized membrane protein (UPF0127 family)
MKRLALLLLVIGCTKAMPPAEPAATTTPAPPAQTHAGPRVIFPDGFVVKVEIADDSDTRAQGLMYRDHLGPGLGMLFFFPESGEYPFWMKNTRIPLDMIWIDADRRIAHVTSDVPPCRVADCPSYPPNAISRYVLEVDAGVAKQHGLKAGDPLRFEGTENVVAR